MSVPRWAASGSALKQDGVLLIAGGAGLSSAELYGFPTIRTDKEDYHPGELVTITGKGWQPGETVTLTLQEAGPYVDDHAPIIVTADESGRIFNREFRPDSHDVDVTFFLTAHGETSNRLAQMTFTDGANAAWTITPSNVLTNSITTFLLSITGLQRA